MVWRIAMDGKTAVKLATAWVTIGRMDSPSGTLAQRIVEKLVREKLLSAAEARKIVAKLAEGKLRAEDWRLAIEISAMQKKSK
jgi:hypothetical protein